MIPSVLLDSLKNAKRGGVLSAFVVTFMQCPKHPIYFKEERKREN